ncbi:MAG: hypothetical protein RIG77_06970 [Cyclobacteriaceae bacterium]
MTKKPDISKLNKKAPLSVPEGYFDKLPDIIQSRIAMEEEEEAIVFKSIPTKQKLPFDVPDGYFEKLPSTIQARAIDTTRSKTPSFGMANQRVKWALVPVLLAIFLIGYSLWHSENNESFDADQLIAQVSSEDLVAYLEMSDISTEEIISEIDFGHIDLDTETDETLLLDELNFTESEMDDILLEFELDSGV